MIHVGLRDSGGTGNEVKVTSRGQLVVSPLDFSSAYNATAAVNDTAYNLVGPENGKQFIITEIILYANQGVSNTADATVIVYEATSSTSTAVASSILTTNMVRQDRIILTGLNLIVTAGRWVNVKTTDNTVYATVFGYYLNA